MVSSQALPQTPALEQNAERLRLTEAHENMKPWYLWGPYLTEDKEAIKVYVEVAQGT